MAKDVASDEVRWHLTNEAAPSVRGLFDSSLLLRRLRRNSTVMKGASILWIDDSPKLSAHEQDALERLGADVVWRLDTEEATRLSEDRGPAPAFDVIVSDIVRPRSGSAGIDDLDEVREAFPDSPVIFYVGIADDARGLPPGAFGLTDRPDELFPLILDALERRRS